MNGCSFERELAMIMKALDKKYGLADTPQHGGK